MARARRADAVTTRLPASAHTQSTAGKLCFTLRVESGVVFPAKPVSKSLESLFLSSPQLGIYFHFDTAVAYHEQAGRWAPPAGRNRWPPPGPVPSSLAAKTKHRELGGFEQHRASSHRLRAHRSEVPSGGSREGAFLPPPAPGGPRCPLARAWPQPPSVGLHLHVASPGCLCLHLAFSPP